MEKVLQKQENLLARDGLIPLPGHTLESPDANVFIVYRHFGTVKTEEEKKVTF